MTPTQEQLARAPMTKTATARDALQAWQEWEAKVILDEEAWNVDDGFRVTGAYYDEYIELQTLRNDGIAAQARAGLGFQAAWDASPTLPPIVFSDAELQHLASALTTPAATEPVEGELRLEWRNGPPPKPWCDEWFIAQTTFSDRVVLRALPEEYTYDFKTADDTYIKAEHVKRWMQFPDSQYIAPVTPSPKQPVDVREALERESICGPVMTVLDKMSQLFGRQCISLSVPGLDANRRQAIILKFADGMDVKVEGATTDQAWRKLYDAAPSPATTPPADGGRPS